MSPKCCIVVSRRLIELVDHAPNLKGRASRVCSLLSSCGLLFMPNARVISPRAASEDELSRFHSREYVAALRRYGSYRGQDDDTEDDGDDLDEVAVNEYGLGYDCPVIPELFDFVSLVGGSSICAAKCLTNRMCDVSVNWFGGWHHAQRDSASGFCFVNDIVLAVHTLASEFTRILYIDLDVHHGDGVENAFLFTDKVYTMSLHLKEDGFFPGSGDSENVGLGNGRFYNLNVPLKEGIHDEAYFNIFSDVFEDVYEAFRPQAIVVQCGGDCLAGDPIGRFNLSISGIARCVKSVLDKSVPTLLLGGGGYNNQLTARLWTTLTAVALRAPALGPDIPTEDKFFLEYGPSYEFEANPRERAKWTDQNSAQHLQRIRETAKEQISKMREARSGQARSIRS